VDKSHEDVGGGVLARESWRQSDGDKIRPSVTAWSGSEILRGRGPAFASIGRRVRNPPMGPTTSCFLARRFDLRYVDEPLARIAQTRVTPIRP
jgi:hypothetical protein